MNLTQMNMMYDPQNGKLVSAFKYNNEGRRTRATIALCNFTDVRKQQGHTRSAKTGYTPTGRRAYHDADSVPAKNEVYPSVVTGRYYGV